ncbi:MAG: ATP-binding cassette domain-containing protein [Candidatus Methanomethylophilaceae archaeon]|nr:ATP-binding cassette domain-containing protein [Candidatus Methanomethylophilaceae archaeon]
MVHRVMRLLDLEEFAMRPFNQLSAGQHQKVALARGLVQETPVIVLDEPTSNLDVRHQVYIAELLRGIAIRQDKQIVMISHDLNIAARYAHRIVMMSEPSVIYKTGKP